MFGFKKFRTMMASFIEDATKDNKVMVDAMQMLGAPFWAHGISVYPDFNVNNRGGDYDGMTEDCTVHEIVYSHFM
jgi:hypothetical protein